MYSFGQNKSAEKLNSLSEKEFQVDNDKSLEHARKANVLANKKSNQFEIGRSHLNIANSLTMSFDLDEALTEVNKSLSTFKNLRNDTMLGKTYLSRGYVYLDKAEYLNSTKDLFQALKYFKKKNHLSGISKSYNALGIVFDESRNSKKALYYYRKAADFSRKIGDRKVEGTALLNMGVILMNDSVNTEAGEYYYRALEIFDSLGFELAKITVLTNIAINHRRMKEYAQAIDVYQEVLDYSEVQKDSMLITRTLNNLANVYLNTNELYKARDMYLRALEISTAITFKDNTRTCYKNLTLTYNKLEDFENAYKYSVLEFELTTEIYNSKKENQILELNEKYQTEQKENDNLILSAENSEEKAKTANLRLWNYGIIGGTLVLSFVLFFLWNRKKQKHNLILEKQKTEALQATIDTSEEEKKRIGKQLHDGIANNLIKYFYEIEDSDPSLSHKFLTAYEEIRNVSHQLDNSARHGTAIFDRIIDLIPSNSLDKFNVNVEPMNLELKEPIGSHVYRIIQELIVNTLKYANSTKNEISIHHHKESILIHYRDNGNGTDSFRQGNGHNNIQDRIKLMKGVSEMETSIDKGFSMKFEIPLI